MKSLKKDNFIRNPSQRKCFEYANVKELSNIMVYHLKDKIHYHITKNHQLIL